MTEPVHFAIVSLQPLEPVMPALSGGLTRRQLGRVAAYIEAHLSECLGVEELARVAGLSNGYFCRCFKRSVGVSVHLYIIHRRIELAQALLLTTDEPMSQVALLCGMADQPHFTRLFHRLVGRPPAMWRRQLCA